VKLKLLRHSKIIELIQEMRIETQEELREKLSQNGFDVTQATVSRDIKELHLIKILTENGNYRYTVSDQGNSQDLAAKFRTLLSETIVKIDYAGNLLVIKCYSGMASAAAAAVDAMNWPEVLGTIAGDDTVLMIMRNEESALQMINELNILRRN
jgi:transcriptional regulator of arginine metabolism